MAKDFFGNLGNLGETISKTAKGLGDRAGEVYETTKIKTKIASEQKLVDKAMADLGKIVYQKYKSGTEVDAEELSICEQIDQYKDQIDELNASLDTVKAEKAKKVCPSCGKAVSKDAAFCPSCGASVPEVEPEDTDENIIEGTATDVTEAAQDAVEEAKDAAEDVAEKAEDAAQDVAEKAEDAAEDVAEKAEDAVQEAKDVVADAAEKVQDAVEDAAEKME